ncbi:hypothetical protein ACJBU6_04162 [Exserohilum turcicum]
MPIIQWPQLPCQPTPAAPSNTTKHTTPHTPPANMLREALAWIQKPLTRVTATMLHCAINKIRACAPCTHVRAFMPAVSLPRPSATHNPARATPMLELPCLPIPPFPAMLHPEVTDVRISIASPSHPHTHSSPYR